MKVTQTPEELEKCRQMAILRIEESSRLKLQNSRNYSPSDFDIEIQTFSYASEVAVAKWLGCQPQITVNQFGPDITGVNRKGEITKIDVKSSFCGRSLLVSPHRLDPTTIYVAVTGSGANCDVLGWASGRDIQISGTLSNLGYPNRPNIYALPNSLLKPIPSGVWHHQ